MRVITLSVLFFLLTATTAFGQAGKIAGTVTDAETGNPLPGVNVVVVGTQQGATTDVEGNYSILNVSPGTYDVRASFVGYAPVTQEGVQVNIDLTSEVNFALQEQTAELEEITVQATEPVVKKDISANVANLSAEDVENLPGVTDLQDIVTRQPGVQGFSVRGGSLSETLLQVDGFAQRDGINNEPIQSVSFTAIQEVQVQTGGFNAEYGNVRSGLINVVTKSAPRDHYTVDVLTRFSPARQKNFGGLPSDEDSFWMRPYLDEEVAFEGTSEWDEYEQAQYQDFEGWNSIADRYNSDANPDNDITPEQLQDIFLFQRRKNLEVATPDYIVDGSVGGPVPGGGALGNLRFFGSYRQGKSAYLIPQRIDGYSERLGSLTLTSDLTQSMKLDLRGMYSRDEGLDLSRRNAPQMAEADGGQYGYAGFLFEVRQDGSTVFANDAISVFDRERLMLGADLTHTLGPNTFYEAKVQRTNSDYLSAPRVMRDTSTVVETIAGRELDETPFGYWPEQLVTDDGMLLGGSWAESRDSSDATTWSGQFDITHQLTQNFQLKGGGTLIQTAHNRNSGFRSTSGGNSEFGWNRDFRQGALYGQTKIEFEGMIANLGARLDYFHALGQWYDFERYAEQLAGLSLEPTAETLEQEDTEHQLFLSPRLGVSFPVSENSKFFFNYGHFRSTLYPDDVFMFNTPYQGGNGRLQAIGNPSHPLPKTTSYELGFEQNLFDKLLFRLTGYYKDISDQATSVRFIGALGNVNYTEANPFSYRDIRGFEALLQKNVGWYRGYLNFTYDARKSGRFGLAQYFENPVEQVNYEQSYRNDAYARVPQPYARASLQLLAPSDFGPEVAGFHPLEGWRLIGDGAWYAGNAFTWEGPGATNLPNVRNNVRWSDTWNFDMRLTKNFASRFGDIQFYVDVNNMLNLKQMNQGALFVDIKQDSDRYMQSLHLPADIFENAEGGAPYNYIPGDDRPGDYREPGVSFVPIEIVPDVQSVADPGTRPLYYETSETGAAANGTYMVYRSGGWEEAEQDLVDSVLEDNQYIDMPNPTSFTFLNPRSYTFGLRVTL